MEIKHLQITSLLTILLIAPSLSIRCYECNSLNDQDCLNIEEETKAKFAVDCSAKENGNKYTLCRKIDMYMDAAFGEGHPAENRVHRACGYLEESVGNHCYYKSGYNTRSWVCSCHSDDCNSVTNLKPPVLLIVIIAILCKFT